MSTASDRIPLIGLSLADAHKISDALMSLSLKLRAEECEQRAVLQEVQSDDNAREGVEAIISAIRYERTNVLATREALTVAICKTFNGLG